MADDNNDREIADMMNVDPRQLCSHFNLVPLVQVAGKRVWHGDSFYIDWYSNIINAHYLKTVKFYCPGCGSIIDAPSEIDGKKGEGCL